MLHQLPDVLLFEVARWRLIACVTRLACVCSSFRRSLHAALGAQRSLMLNESDVDGVTPEFAELLAQLPKLRMLVIGEVEISTETLRSEALIDLCLLRPPLSFCPASFACLTAPFLRANRNLRWVRLRPCNTAWLCVVTMRKGGQLNWSAVCASSPSSRPTNAEVVMLAALLESPRGSAPLSLQIDLRDLSPASGLALAVAERRLCREFVEIHTGVYRERYASMDAKALGCGALTTLAGSRRRRSLYRSLWRPRRLLRLLSGSDVVLLLLLVLACVVLRFFENRYAQATGYRGARCSSHPLRLASAVEQLALQRLPRGETSGGRGDALFSHSATSSPARTWHGPSHATPPHATPSHATPSTAPMPSHATPCHPCTCTPSPMPPHRPCHPWPCHPMPPHPNPTPPSP